VGFLKVLALFAAVAIIVAAVIFVRALSPRRWPRIAAVAGLSSLVVAIALYVVLVLIALNYYDERSRLSWLTALAVSALVLAGGGLTAIVAAAFGAAKRMSRTRT
jgi:hypothetical protein